MTCHHVTGECVNSVCAAGYHGTSCQQGEYNQGLDNFLMVYISFAGHGPQKFDLQDTLRCLYYDSKYDRDKMSLVMKIFP